MKLATVEKKTEILKLRNLFFKEQENNQENSPDNEINSENKKQKAVQIFINPDRTFNERMEYKSLRDIKKAREAEGEENLVIRNGKIIKNQPFRFDPQSDWV